jgi:class 3 adenylate cyclase
MPDISEQRKLAAIMFTDMVGYSALSQRDDKFASTLVSAKTMSRWLEHALEHRDRSTLGWIKVDPLLEQFRGHSRFEALVKWVVAPKTDAKQ